MALPLTQNDPTTNNRIQHYNYVLRNLQSRLNRSNLNMIQTLIVSAENSLISVLQNPPDNWKNQNLLAINADINNIRHWRQQFHLPPSQLAMLQPPPPPPPPQQGQAQHQVPIPPTNYALKSAKYGLFATGAYFTFTGVGSIFTSANTLLSAGIKEAGKEFAGGYARAAIGAAIIQTSKKM